MSKQSFLVCLLMLATLFANAQSTFQSNTSRQQSSILDKSENDYQLRSSSKLPIVNNGAFNWIKIDSVNYSAHRLKTLANGKILAGYWDKFGLRQYDPMLNRWDTLIARFNTPLISSTTVLDIEDIVEMTDASKILFGVDCEGGFEYNAKSLNLYHYISLGSCVERFFVWRGYLLASTYTNGVLAVPIADLPSGVWKQVFNPINDRIWSFMSDKDSNLILGGQRAIYRTFELAVFDTVFFLDSTPPNNAVWDMFYDVKNRTYFAATGQGLLRSWNLINWYSAGLTGLPLHAICYDSNRRMIYIAAGERLQTNGITGGVFVGSSWDTVWSLIGLSPMSVQSIALDAGGALYAATADYGIWKLDACERYIVVKDSIIYRDKDTVYIFNKSIHDTVLVKQFIHDTTIVVKYDTLRVRTNDTIIVIDTLKTFIHDTTIIAKIDTIRINNVVTDTLTIDTCILGGKRLRVIQCNDTLWFDSDSTLMSVVVYPNPINDIINVKIDINLQNKSIALLLVDPAGVMFAVERFDLYRGKNNIQIKIKQALASGTYYLMVVDNDIFIGAFVVIVRR